MSMRAGGTPRPGRGGGGSSVAEQRVNLARALSPQNVSVLPTSVAWDTVNWQSGFTVSPGDSAIVIPATGRYQINFNLNIAFIDDTDALATGFVEATVKVGGAFVLQAPHNAVRLLSSGGTGWAVGQNSYIFVPCVGVMDLTVGDSLTFVVVDVPTPAGAFVPQIAQVAASAGSPGTTLSIHRLGA